jgi:dTDP-glucose 4,6-dehydratase
MSDEAMPVNLGNPREMTILEFAKTIEQLIGSRAGRVNRGLPQDDPKQRRPDISKAQRVLGWNPVVPLEDGMRETLAYFRSLVATVA